jgi:hypothetical protein
MAIASRVATRVAAERELMEEGAGGEKTEKAM